MKSSAADACAAASELRPCRRDPRVNQDTRAMRPSKRNAPNTSIGGSGPMRKQAYQGCSPLGREQPIIQTEVRMALESNASRMRSASVLTGIHCYDYSNSMGRERFGWTYDRCCVFPSVGDRTRLTGRRVPLSGCASLPWFRIGKRRLDIAGISCSSAKLLFVGCIHEISDDAR